MGPQDNDLTDNFTKNRFLVLFDEVVHQPETHLPPQRSVCAGSPLDVILNNFQALSR